MSLGGFSDYVKDNQWLLDPVIDVDGETCEFKGKQVDLLDAIDDMTEEMEENPDYCNEENEERERVRMFYFISWNIHKLLIFQKQKCSSTR